MRIIYAKPLRKFKLSRRPDKRYHMIRTLVTQLIQHERIFTTTAKAKHMKSTAERIIAIARRIAYKGNNRLDHNIYRMIRSPEARVNLFKNILPKVRDIKGSCFRVRFVKRRKGDNAPISYIELVNR